MSTMAKKKKKKDLENRQLHHIFFKCDLTYLYLFFPGNLLSKYSKVKTGKNGRPKWKI